MAEGYRVAQRVGYLLHSALEARGRCGLTQLLCTNNATEDRAFKLRRHAFHGSERTVQSAAFDRCAQHSNLTERGCESSFERYNLTAQFLNLSSAIRCSKPAHGFPK